MGREFSAGPTCRAANRRGGAGGSGGSPGVAGVERQAGRQAGRRVKGPGGEGRRK